MNPAMDIQQRKIQVENAKAQRNQIQSRVTLTHECIETLVKAGSDPACSSEPLLVAICKVQLAQLRFAEQEGLASIKQLDEFIKHNETPLFGASLIPPTGRPRH